MRLLIVTQKVNESDPVLGFFVDWLREFAAHVETLEVICLEQGNASLPNNVTVHSLGKEHREASSMQYAVRFFGLTWKLRSHYDAVFVHMNPEYVVLAGWMWRMLHKPVALWYLHKSVTWKLRVAEFFVNSIFTATPESFRLPSKKIYVTGHGIDIHALTPLPALRGTTPLRLITVGRLSPIKRVDLLIAAVSELRARNISVQLQIIGSPAGAEGIAYEKRLREQVASQKLEDCIEFTGPVAHSALREYFARAHLFVHASETGSLDKAILEPLAVGMTVVTTSVPSGADDIPAIVAAASSAGGIADAIQEAMRDQLWAQDDVRAGARTYIEQNHSLSALIPKILRVLA